MDRQQLIKQMTEQVQAAAKRIGDEASASRQDMATMEKLIYHEMDAAKAKLLQAWVDHAQDDSQRPTCPHCQGRMRQKERSPKTSACVGGQVTVERTRWYCPSCKASFFPSG